MLRDHEPVATGLNEPVNIVGVDPGVIFTVAFTPGSTVDVSDRAARLLGHVSVDNFPATVDVSDRAGRLIGHVTVDAATIAALTDGSQRVGGTLDVSDRVGRLIGHVNVDNFPATSDVSDRAARLLGHTTVDAATIAAMTDGTQRLIGSSNGVTALSAANAAVTLTLPAGGIGLFHYITSIEVVRFNPTVTAIAAAATELTITSTNLPGNLAWSSGTLLAAGARETLVLLAFTNSPVKVNAANTATTIVAPAYGAGTKARINVTYYLSV